MDMTVSSLMTDSVSASWAIALLRWVIGLALLPHGVQKFRDPALARNFPAVMGLSSRLSFVVAMSVELGASVCLLSGFCTRLAALAGIGVMAVAYRVSKGPYFTSPALPFLLGFIAVLITGPGQYSLDALLLSRL